MPVIFFLNANIHNENICSQNCLFSEKSDSNHNSESDNGCNMYLFFVIRGHIQCQSQWTYCSALYTEGSFVFNINPQLKSIYFEVLKPQVSLNSHLFKLG